MSTGVVDKALLTPSQNLSRIRWQCRRGILELDALLEIFVDAGFLMMTKQQQDLFEEILTYPDQLLHDYFFGTSKAIDKDVASVIQLIKNTAHDQVTSI